VAAGDVTGDGLATSSPAQPWRQPTSGCSKPARRAPPAKVASSPRPRLPGGVSGYRCRRVTEMSARHRHRRRIRRAHVRYSASTALVRFCCFASGIHGRVTVATSHMTGDSRADIITGAGPGGLCIRALTAPRAPRGMELLRLGALHRRCRRRGLA
jgi:hypothetical protein